MDRSSTVDTQQLEGITGIVKPGLIAARVILATVVAFHQHGE
jgi:hypothetical protein